MSEELKTMNEQKHSPPQVTQAKMPKGLIATGLVAIVGSWFGMAVYMNHRITDLENGLRSQNNKVISSIDVNTETLTKKFDSSSSVFAQALIDISDKQEKRHTDLQSVIQLSHKELEAALSHQQQKQTDTISTVLSAYNESQSTTSQTVLTAIQDTKTALEAFVQTGMQNQNQQLSEIASAVNRIPVDDGEKTKMIHAQLTAMSERIQEFQQQLVDSKASIDELNHSIPNLQTSVSQEMSGLSARISEYETQLIQHLQMVQEQVSTVQQNMDHSSENLLKTLYMTTEGLEGTKYELKSEVETMKQSAKQDFEKLNESINSISTSLYEIKQDLANDSIDTTSLQPDIINQVIDSVQMFSDRSISLNQELQSHINEVKAWLEKGSDGTPLDVSFYQKMVNDYQSYLDLNQKQITALIHSINEVKLSSASQPQDNSTENSAEDTQEKVDEDKQTALHPEERSQSEVGVSLY